MSNMSYCRFRNTRNDLSDCLEALRDNDELSEEEAKAARWMFEDFIDFLGFLHRWSWPLQVGIVLLLLS